MFSNKNIALKRKYDNYKYEQVTAAAEWFINAIEFEIPRIRNIINCIYFNDKELESELRSHIFDYDPQYNHGWEIFTQQQRDAFKSHFVKHLWELCGFNDSVNKFSYLHFGTVDSRFSLNDYKAVRQVILDSLDAASIPRNIIDGIIIGCHLLRDGNVVASVSVGSLQIPYTKTIYEHGILANVSDLFCVRMPV